MVSRGPTLTFICTPPSDGVVYLLAEPLPAEWTLGDATGPPIYTGMDLTHFICINCKWSAAADLNLVHQHNLEWLDISFNPVAPLNNIGPNTLPAEWKYLPLVALKVSVTLLGEGSNGDIS